MLEKLIEIFGPVRMAIFGTVLIIALGDRRVVFDCMGRRRFQASAISSSGHRRGRGARPPYICWRDSEIGSK
jgi:hypothetical protein